MVAPADLQVGGTVTRVLAGVVRMPLRVTALTPELVTCGAWQFDRATGAEIDAELGWGPPPLATGSYLELGHG